MLCVYTHLNKFERGLDPMRLHNKQNWFILHFNINKCVYKYNVCKVYDFVHKYLNNKYLD